jgi:uncharacterized protein (TIGR03084 family)
MSVDLGLLADDVQAEHDDLARLLAPLDEPTWDAVTTREGWTVRDQITHLAFFDGVARAALTDTSEFARFRDDARPDVATYVEAVREHGRHLTGPEMLAWFADERAHFVAALRDAEPSASVPWFGHEMKPASKGTARLMETWAHGQDIVDALQLDRAPTARLRHVAHIGVRALPNAYRIHGLAVPAVPIRVTLASPDGGTWTWGEADAPDRVEGAALDFCLVVTQRRHVDDTDLVVTGDTARQWMLVAQAYAGPPGPGRRPGEFRRGGASRSRP